MRISDWSSDVCSSYLLALGRRFDHEPTGRHADDAVDRLDPFERGVACLGVDLFLLYQPAEQIGRASCRARSVSVRVELGGRRHINKTTTTERASMHDKWN